MSNIMIYLSVAFFIKFINDMMNNENPFHLFKTLEVEEDYRVDKVHQTNYGSKMTIECMRNGTYETVEQMIPIFNKLYKCKTFVENVENSHNVTVDLVKNIDNLTYTYKKLSPYELLIGYDYKNNPITINMKITPHLAIQGISNNGKTKCVETIVNNLRGCTFDILNAMAEDFPNCKANRINGDDNIIDYMYYLTHDEEVREVPRYVIIDEYNVLSHLKSFDESITDLLRQARHRNIFIILIAQQLQLEYCSFRDLFNSRLTFKQINKHSIYSFLGQQVDNTDLKQREFILLHQKLEYGKTYKIL